MRAGVEPGHSRFPVHGEGKDGIPGILLAKDLLRGVVQDGGANCIGRPPYATHGAIHGQEPV